MSCTTIPNESERQAEGPHAGCGGPARSDAHEDCCHAGEHYGPLFEHHPQPMWVFDLETLGFLEVNDAAVRHYGYAREEFLAMTLKNIRPPEDEPPPLHAVLRSGQSVSEPPRSFRHLQKCGPGI